MTIWKKSSPKSGKSELPERPGLYIRMKKEIEPLRKQGEMPIKVASSFSRYYCDLCNSQFPIEELRQCSICGRWGCNNCWTNEFYLCNSCNGIAKLFLTKTDS